MPSGLILKGIDGFYYVKTEDGIYECKARGLFRKQSVTPLPGDRVSILVVDIDKKIGYIDEILPRDMQLLRPAVANVNQLAMVISVNSPKPDLFLLDKLLVTASNKGLGAVICINKIDFSKEDEHVKICDSYNKAGYDVVLLSSTLDVGFDCLEKALVGKITVFAGQSGVGKSTILNKILNAYVMPTGEISEKINRGKHTTRHAELLELKSGGYVVDTPGFSSFELNGIEPDELQRYYPEFDIFLGKCKYSGCSHISEPGCEVKAALEKGDLDTCRYSSYIEFYNCLKEQKRKKYS